MPRPPVTLILHNGRIRTMAEVADVGSTLTALAVAGDRIVALGTDAEVLARREAGTRGVDLHGRTVLPGFVDAHTHPISGGLRHIECNLDRYSRPDEHLGAIAAYAAANPDRTWIYGDGWSMESFPGGIPRREALDAIVPDRPVFLYNRDGHGAWVNSRALELAGITAETPDPPNGRIERDPDGTPVGMLQESATALVDRLIQPHTATELETAILAAQAELHAMGITGWQDANVHPDRLAAYRAVAGRGDLTARVVAALGADDLEAFGGFDGLVAVRGAVAADTRGFAPSVPGSPRLAATAVKFFVDGVLENRTGALLSPYLDPEGRPTGGTGFSNREPAQLNRLAVELDARGFQLHYHAIGDRAVRESLDAIEAARGANGARDSRHHIAHIQLIHPDDVPRFGALGAVANMQPYWAVHETQMDVLTIPILGPERTRWQYPFGSLLRSGARLAMGSDWTVSTAEPLRLIEVAVNRVDDFHRDGEPFLPEQRLTLDEALRAATAGSAFVNGLDEGGWLGVGRLADLVVLDRELGAAGAGPIGDALAVATMVGGDLVFEADALEA